MRLEVVCAMLAIAVVTIGTSAEDSGRPWRNYVDADEDGRSVRDALDGGRPWRNYVDDERSVRVAHDDDDGRSIRADRRRCVRHVISAVAPTIRVRQYTMSSVVQAIRLLADNL
ncbi:hypothetical protein EMCRGX_G019669 [Ephydatia muelleri]